MDFWVLYSGFIGLFFGSFFNVLVDRLPKGKSVVLDRSECDYCHKELRWYELLPVISFVLQNGTCRRCHHRLSLRYPVSEIATALLFASITFLTISTSPFFTILVLLIASPLWVILWTDLFFYFIPDSLLLFGITVSLLTFFSLPLSDIGLHLLAASGASGFFYLLWFVTRGKGMGFGDVKLVFLLGLILGSSRIVGALYLAFLTGAIIGIILIVSRKKELKSKIPFGPFLIIGAAISCVLPPTMEWIVWLGNMGLH